MYEYEYTTSDNDVDDEYNGLDWCICAKYTVMETAP